jgi:hypothetical protein
VISPVLLRKCRVADSPPPFFYTCVIETASHLLAKHILFAFITRPIMFPYLHQLVRKIIGGVVLKIKRLGQPSTQFQVESNEHVP